MVDYSGLRLWTDFTPGWLLPLREAPRASGRHSFSDGVQVEIRAHVRAVVVRCLPSVGESNLPATVARVNEALDIFSGCGIASVSLGDVASLRMCWFIDADKVLRVITKVTMQFRMGVGGFTKDLDGQVVYHPLPGTWHRSLRYFRLSQSTDDLFDAFRNLYLALESLLNDVAPRRAGEREGDWLRRAVVGAGSHVDLSQYPSGPAGMEAVSLYAELWTGIRNKIFHAKTGTASFLPFDTGPRRPVLDALIRFARLYTALAEALLGIRFHSSGIGQAAFDVIRSSLTQYDLVVADDDTPFDAAETAPSPRGRPTVSLRTSATSDYDGPFSCAVRGVAAASDVRREVAAITRIVGRHGELAASVEVLDGRLNIEGADTFEVDLIMSATGSTIRESYPS